MAPEALATELQALVGRKIAHKSITGNSIWLWLGEGKEFGIYIDPPWRLSDTKSIVGTSADFPWEKEENETELEYKSRFEVACSYTDLLINQSIQSINIDHISNDLTIEFSNGLRLQNFAVWRNEDNWQYVNYASDKRFLISSSGVALESANT